MSTAQHPARQLNSKSIRDATISYVLPEVQNKFCVVGAHCVWRVEGNGTRKAWELICDKRSQCDRAIEDLPGVAFFFSAISSSENPSSKKGKKTPTEVDSVEEDEDENIVSTQTTASSDISACTSSAINTAMEKGRLPAIAYWIALESPNGAPVPLVRMHRNLLNCDVEINIKVLTSRKGVASEIVKRLCTVLKDHNSSYLGDIVNASFQSCFTDATDSLDESPDLEDAREDLQEHALRFVLVNNQYAQRMRRVIEALMRAGLQLDVFGLDVERNIVGQPSSVVPKAITTDHCTQLINDIEILMQRLGYAINQGMVFKKHEKAIYTYTYKCEINSFIGALEGNESMKSRLVKYGERIKEKLKNPKSQLIHQLQIMYDLIEINDGWCLSLSQREFVQVPMQKGKVSPRAFFEFNKNTTPDAKFFQEILKNSLSEEEIGNFCHDFLNLFQHQKKGHKQKVS